MFKSKSIHKMAKFLNALSSHIDDTGKSDGKLSPEVISQLEAIEADFYGLMDRYAFSHIDMNGKPIHIDAATAKSFRELLDTVHSTEGERGNSPERWFNTLTQFPLGTLDGILHVEAQVRKFNANTEETKIQYREPMSI